MEVMGATPEGCWSAEWETVLGKMEKEEAGRDQDVGTMRWQEADLDVQEKSVQIPRKRG